MTIYCGVDFHARQQTVAYCDTADGGLHLREPDHVRDDVRGFYSSLTGEIVVGIEAGGYGTWFVELVEGLGHEVLIGTRPRSGGWRSANFQRGLCREVESAERGRAGAVHTGLEPMEDSSGDKQQFGSISKGGSRLLRYLLVEAAQITVRRDEGLKRFLLQAPEPPGRAEGAGGGRPPVPSAGVRSGLYGRLMRGGMTGARRQKALKRV